MAKKSSNARRPVRRHVVIFHRINKRLFGSALAIIGLGYLCLMQGPVDSTLSRSLAPLILVTGYAVFLPCAILWGRNGRTS